MNALTIRLRQNGGEGESLGHGQLATAPAVTFCPERESPIVYPLSAREKRAVQWAERLVPAFGIGVLVLLLALGSACAQIKPETRIGYGWAGFSFVDSKDNNIEIQNLDIDPTNKRAHADTIIIRNNASDPIRENVAQMLAFVEQQRAANQGVQVALTGIARLIGAVAAGIPTVSGTVDTPVGTITGNVKASGTAGLGADPRVLSLDEWVRLWNRAHAPDLGGTVAPGEDTGNPGAAGAGD